MTGAKRLPLRMKGIAGHLLDSPVSMATFRFTRDRQAG